MQPKCTEMLTTHLRLHHISQIAQIWSSFWLVWIFLPSLQGTGVSWGEALWFQSPWRHCHRTPCSPTLPTQWYYETVLESCLVMNTWELFLNKAKKKNHLTLSSGRWHSIKYLFLKQHWNMFMCLTCILNNQSYSRFLQSGQVCNPSTLSLNFSSPIDSLARAKHLCSHDCFQSQVKAVCGKRAGFKKWMGPRYPQSILRAVNIRTLLSFPYAFLGKPASKLTQCTHTGKYIWEMSFEIHPFIVSVII